MTFMLRTIWFDKTDTLYTQISKNLIDKEILVTLIN
jgi:hypothetical protein